jgi:hypothetical protein
MTVRQVRRRLDTGRLGFTWVGHKRFVSGLQILVYQEANRVDPLPEHLQPRLGER